MGMYHSGRARRIELSRRQRARRSRLSRTIVVLLVAFLGVTLFELQIVHGDHYSLLATANRLRPLSVPAPRGTIYDRHGRIVAENLVGYRVLLMPAPVRVVRARLDSLAPRLGLGGEEVERLLRAYAREPHLPLTLLADAGPRAAARVLEGKRPEGVLVREYPKRRYPGGSAVAHLAGYVGEISERERALPGLREYQQGRLIGKAGLERQYERVLGGQPGTEYLEVDARGRIQRWAPDELRVPSVPGHDLQLYLDLDLQSYVAEVFEDLRLHEELSSRNPIEGAFVALEPETGGVLAYYSTPGYDPNAFIGGISGSTWNRLNADATKPLLDRVAGTGAPQPPGSTFKLMLAAMALEEGVITPESHMPVPCTGGLTFQGRYAKCWCDGCYWDFDLIEAIEHSCNVYFYQLGIKLGLERFLEKGTELGFARRTGIDLPGESPSIFPGGIDWMTQWLGYRPPENEIMSLSIGQGTVTMTPLKMAQMYLALARHDGKAPAPRIARTDAPQPITFELNLPPEQIEALRDGLRRVVGPGGTAWLSRLQGWDFMGKTGTAQNPHGTDHAWFAGIGGTEGGEPEIVAVALVQFGGHGYVASEPVANAINFYMSRKHGRPFERYPVPRVRSLLGLPIDWNWLRSPVEQRWDASRADAAVVSSGT